MQPAERPQPAPFSPLPPRRVARSADVAVQADDGRIRVIEFHPDGNYVYVWEDERFLATLNREGFSDWLAVPLAPASISVGRITLAYTLGLGITLTLAGITAAPIPEDARTRMRQLLRY